MYRVIILSFYLYIASFQLIYANCTSQISSLEQGVGTGFLDGIDGPYIDNSDGTVTDQGTGLMWQKADEGVEGQGYLAWDAACQYCANLILANHSDWQVPDVIQLQSLLDGGYDPTINTNYFSSTKTSDAYWTASTFTDYTSDAWLIYFSDGSVNHDDKNYAIYIRCVRTASSGSNTDLSFSTAVDSSSGDTPFVATFSSLVISGTPEYTYSWDFGDGSSSSDPSPVHTYTTAGTYTATLTVVDSGGNSAYKSITITAGSTNTSDSIVIWANNGEDKVTRDELRANTNSAGVVNSVWDGQKVSIFGAKNEVVAFNLILESPSSTSNDISVSFNTLSDSAGGQISSITATGNGVFKWINRNIELFYVRYLEIKGVSTDIFFAGYNYDERHIPERFRRPWTGDGEGTGAWEDRPDHNKFYPDIAVPLELVNTFDIASGQNQSIWVDIYIPKTVSAGVFTGSITIRESSNLVKEIPVELTVKDFTLPDLPTARTMLVYTTENINQRYLGNGYPEQGSAEYSQSLSLIDTHFQLAHRHRISLIDSYIETEQMNQEWGSRLSGSLFTAEKGYAGPGVGVGNNVFSIGTYSSWPWSDGTQADMWTNTNTWVDWFDAQAFTTPTEYFLYLIDESSEFTQTELWAQWINSNTGSGSRLMSLATIGLPDAVASVPSLDIPTAWVQMAITDQWQNAADAIKADPNKRLFLYNGGRPGSGTFAIEDEGVSPRVLAWTHYKMKADRWFYWESTYYDNYQAGMGETNVFQKAQVYGSLDRVDSSLGETGWNYLNGDGVLLYPGTDTQYPNESYGVNGPLASLRLKHWRRGLQDFEYLTLASTINAAQTNQIVNQIVPKVAWEVGVESVEDPTYVYTDISWPTDPDVWEKARKDLVDIITEGNIILTTPYYRDSDSDGYGDPNNSMESDHQSSGYVLNNTDCNDYDSSIHPGAPEIGGDGIDQDCNGNDGSTQHLVTEIYVATFERAPAYSGLMYWTNAVETGDFTIEQVAQSFFDQPETKAKFSEGSSNTEFITTIYQNTLSRAPAAAGLAYWVEALNRGAFRRDQAIMAIINGAKAATGSPADAAMLAKKTEIGLCFANSEIGNSTTNENFMNWAKNIINSATSSDFNVEEAEEYIAELLFNN